MAGWGFVLVLLLVFLVGQPNDPLNLLRSHDTPWLIRTGQWILANHRIPDHNILSFFPALQQFPWVCYQWGYEVLLGLAYQWAQLPGVVLFTGVVLALIPTIALLWLKAKGIVSHHGRLMALVGLLVILPMFWMARPFTMSFLFTAILLWRLSSNRHRWLLPVLFALWSNVHLGFTVGLLVLLVWAIQHRAWGWLVGCILATGLNPYGFTLYGYLLQLGNSAFLNAHIQELQSFNFHQSIPTLLFFIGSVAAATVSFSDNRLMRWERWLYFISLFLALYGSRHSYLFALVSMSCIAIAIERFVPASKPLSTHYPAMGLFMVTGVIVAAYVAPSLSLDYPPQAYPRLAAAHLNPNVPVFCSPEWGSYLPNAVMDTRFDMFGDDYSRTMAGLYNMEPGWSGVWDQFDFQSAILPLNHPLAETLKSLYHWQVTYQDKEAIVLQKP